jgi:UDP-N-acetylmuramate dehydrogenase
MLKTNTNIEEKIIFDEPMKKHTSFKIGGTADEFIKATNEEELKEAIKYAKGKNLKITIIGNGSNLLVLDKGIRGLVIKIDIQKLEIGRKKKYAEITVGSGYKTMALGIKLMNEELSGFEELSGIPGTIGGAIFMNAGAYGKEIKDINISTKCMDYDGEIFELSNKEQEFEYRSSVFNKKDYIILETKLRLEYGKKEEIKKKMDEYLSSRKEKQPIEYPSAGSTFKRQEGIITAKLIDECGLKGFQIGGAKVSEKHAGFVINSDNATAKDVIDLIKYIKEKVNEKYGIKIKEEIRIVGEE